MEKNKVTVIIATTAEKTRKEQLKRAIESVLSQQGCEFSLLVVINGKRFDQQLKMRLEEDARINCRYREEGNYPKAISFARSLLETTYFCFLDDDDELLPQTLAVRVKVLKENEKIDVVVSNGVRNRYDKQLTECHPDILSYQKDPLGQLLKYDGTWLSSPAGMYRTSRIPQKYFDDYTPYGEWTYMAYKIALFNKVHFISDKCFKINMQLRSLSHGPDYLDGLYQMHKKVLSMLTARKDINKMKEKLADFEHVIANQQLQKGQLKKAWFYHLKSLAHIKGLKKYFIFTRKLLFPSFYQ